MEALSRQSSSWYKLPTVSVPKFKADGDWRCFIADLKDTKRLADLKLSHQLAKLKRAVPEEAKRLLYQEQVETVERALEVVTECYEPLKDSLTLIQEILKITKQPGAKSFWQDK